MFQTATCNCAGIVDPAQQNLPSLKRPRLHNAYPFETGVISRTQQHPSPLIWWQVKKFQAPSQPALPELFSFSSHPVSWPWRNSAPRISWEDVNLCYSPRCLRPFERQESFAAKRIRPPNFRLHTGGAWLPDPACSVIIRPSVRSCLGNVG